nr:RNA-directed DNA polymerase, eukaryota [Tanacetum cinerariifolium]
MGAHNKNPFQSKADQTVRISKFIFVSNFPEGCTAKDLWKVCNNYGTVVDVFIPNKKSKVGKRFAFVRFIKVINLHRLIENLNTIWIGRFHLFANPVRFERPKKPNLSPHNNAAAASSYPQGVDQAKGQFQTGSYVDVVNGSSPMGVYGPSISFVSVLVLDDSCVAERDLLNHVMGNVKDVSSISNLRTLIMEEGFSVVNLVYLRGLWVMIECDNVETKTNMLQPTGVKSWFHVLQNVVHDFVSDERIVWVDIKGIPLNVWSRETFTRIGKKWGEVLDIEDNVDSSLGRKRLCIKTKLPLLILESFKGPNDDRVSDVEEVSETNFGDNSSIPINNIDELEMQQSEDPFNIYRLLRKQPGDESHEVSSSLSHPSGFTPDVSGGSVLGVMEDMIRVGKVMGYSMDGCVKDLDEAVGNSGGILYVWEATVFKKDYATILDNFVAIYGTWLPSNSKVLFVAIYAPQQVSLKRLLWDYVSTLIDRWNGEVVVLGDFNEVWNIDERHGSCFNPTSARVFDQFISTSGLVDVKMKGYTFTWSHHSVCLDLHLSDHRPIILCEVQADFGPIPFWFYHSWISLEGFDAMDLKVRFRAWIKDKRSSVFGEKDSIKKELSDIDRLLDGGDVSDSNLLRRSELHRNLYNINQMESKEYLQKSKIKWAFEGDENSKFFHGLINKKRSQHAIRGVFVDGIWCTNTNKVKEAFFKHFEARFKKPVHHRLKINFLSSKRLSDVQASDLERRVSRDEIRLAVWNCGENKSLGPDGYSFEFFRKYWNLIGSDLWSVYKVVTKVLANRLVLVISDLISDTQSAFVANRQILDGPFILNELLHW